MILAIDIGSSSVRAGIYDEQAKPLRGAAAKVAYSFGRTANGGSEIDADLLLAHVKKAVDAVLAKSTVPITHVAMCSFWHSLVGVDAKGKPTTKVLGWADTRSREYSAVLKKRFDERAIHNRTGAHFHSSFWPAKLLWLRHDQPEVWRRTSQWLSFSDYVALKLFGTAATSISMSSGTGIFDQRKCVWDGELLRFLNVKRAQLPAICDDGDTFRLSRKYVKCWPQLADAEWSPAIADGAADNIGSDCTTKNKAALMVGTSAAMRVAYTGDPPKQIPDGLWCYRIDRKKVIIGGALSDGGNLYALIKDRFKLPKNADSLVAQREPADGLVVIPFFHGERSTGYNEAATGAIIGLTAAHDGIDVLRAAMEGVAFRLADIYERLSKITTIETIVASGGALRDSPVWTQIIADALGHDLAFSEVEEASLRGTAILGTV